MKSDKSVRYPRIKVNFSLLVDDPLIMHCSKTIQWKYHDAMEEIAYEYKLI